MLNNKKYIEQNDIVYNRDGKPFVEIFEIAVSANYSDINMKHEQDIERICSSFNYQYELMSHYIGLFQVAYINRANTLLFSTFHKSLINLKTAFYLNRRSLWGPLRPLIRQVFESLMISKYCALNYESQEVLKFWEEGKQISMGKIFKTMEVSDLNTLKELWGVLSDITHATKFASQPTLTYGTNRTDTADVVVNFIWIELMLECKYHLLTEHIITSSMTYYLKYYAPERYERVKLLKKLLRQNYSESKKRMKGDERKILQAYKNSWSVKN